MEKNSIAGFELDQIQLENVVGGTKTTETTMTNGNCDEITWSGLFNRRIDSIYEGEPVNS